MAAATSTPTRPRAARPAPQRRPLSAGTAAIIGIPTLLIILFVWQFVSPLLKPETIVRDPVAISRVSLEPDAAGTRIDLVVVDRMGQETTADGTLNVKLQEPDGAVWQATRSITAADFGPLPGDGLLAGRQGYSVSVPASDWARPPRHGGTATVSVSLQPNSGAAVSTVEQTRFP
jgi:hypothetical protein